MAKAKKKVGASKKRKGTGKGRAAKKAAKRSKKAAGKAKLAKGAGKPKRAAKQKAAKAKAPTLEALARKIVRAGQDPSAPVLELYAADCVSVEGSGEVSRGLAGIEEKMRRWEQMQRGARFKARHVWLGKNTVCVEWDGEVDLRDGPTVELHEVAVHEIENGKIVSERYYYNPLSLAPPSGAPPTGG